MADDNDRKRMDEIRKSVATALNGLENANESLRGLCEHRGWNNEVCYQIEDGCTRLGFALATLTNWFDFLEEDADAKHEAD